MQVSTWVKESIDEALLYASLEHRPDVIAGFLRSGDPTLSEFVSSLDASFFNVYNQSCGYYQLKRFSATRGDAAKLSLVEDATEYRLIDCPHRRLQRAKALLAAYASSNLFSDDCPCDLGISDEGECCLYYLCWCCWWWWIKNLRQLSPLLFTNSLNTFPSPFHSIYPPLVDTDKRGEGMSRFRPSQSHPCRSSSSSSNSSINSNGGGGDATTLSSAEIYCTLPRGNNLATVLERFSTHHSVGSEESSPRMQALRSSRGGGAAHHHLLPGANATTARPIVGVDDESRLESNRAVSSSSSSSSHNTIASSSSSWSVEDEGVLSEAIGRSARHVNGIPCFLLQAYRSYSRRLQRPSVLWEVVRLAIRKADAAAIAQTHTSKGERKKGASLLVNEHSSPSSSSSSSMSSSSTNASDSSQHELSRDLFDNLIVLAVNYVQRFIFPAFVVSPCFFLYSNMLLFAFSRPVKTRANFEWIKPLGRGGYGMVYAAQSSDTGKLYAVKCMDKRLIKSRHATRMIMNERDILASVSNPFVTGLQFAFHDDANVFLVLDLKTGGDLEHYLLHMTRGFTENEVRFFLAEILLGVAYLHSHGIMHRDLKPANILIDQNGHLSISDLGLAVFFAPSTTSTHKITNALANSSSPQSSSVSTSSSSSSSLMSPLSSPTPLSTTANSIPNKNAATFLPSSSLSAPSQQVNSIITTPQGVAHNAADNNTTLVGDASLLPANIDTANAAIADHVPGLPTTYSAPLSPGVTTMTVSPFASVIEERGGENAEHRYISGGNSNGGVGDNASSLLLSSSVTGFKVNSSSSGTVADLSTSSTAAENCLFGSTLPQHASWVGGGGAAKQLAVSENLSSPSSIGGGAGVQFQNQTGGIASTVRVQSTFARYNTPQQSPIQGGGGGGGGMIASPTLPVCSNNKQQQHQHQQQHSLIKGNDLPNTSSSNSIGGGGGVGAIQSEVTHTAQQLYHVSNSAFSSSLGKTPHPSRKAPLTHASTTPIHPTTNALWGKIGSTVSPSSVIALASEESTQAGISGVYTPNTVLPIMNSATSLINNNSNQTYLHDRSRSTTPLGSPMIPSSSLHPGSGSFSRSVARCSIGGGGKGDGGSSSAWEWDQNLTFTAAEGAGISASEEAGYTFGSHENGVRGKAGTPGFWAPEMLFYERDGKGKRYGPAADWWSFGCLAYALIASKGPFTVIGGDTADDNNATLQNEPDLTSSKLFSPEAADLISKLLIKDPRQRLGSGAGGAEDIMNHPFFKGINWDAIQQKRTAPPFTPTFNVLAMTKPVRSWSEKDKAKLAGVTLTVADQARYVGVPFSSQVSVYKAIIQNMALREYVEAELGGAIGSREGQGREDGGGKGGGGGGAGGGSGGSGGSNSINATARSDKSGSGGGVNIVSATAASASVHRSNNNNNNHHNHHKSGGTIITTTMTTTTTTTTTAQSHSKRHLVRPTGSSSLPPPASSSSSASGIAGLASTVAGGGVTDGGLPSSSLSTSQTKNLLNKRDCCIS